MEVIKKQFKKIKRESEEIKNEAKKKVVGYIVAAFGLVAGLAWNEAIKAFIEYIFPLSANTLLVKFIYAFLVTLAVVLISVYLVRLFGENKKENE
ncbi:hypothetical protein A3J77_01945 [Candidatus Wolfebacteria bacterium RBG_13_41_7]|uniref:Uncharacterized protein n=1 Tax=Candidatus Wolfebacteria bacterium RBG_13_41_7 TaxID=1802554 RepID=A0A1F8DLC1_9BACT|nr:MAG: hypothetical protein A3J77_01945 [Candidatus Wolfebacteria bacterium RBG_13_41_7]